MQPIPRQTQDKWTVALTEQIQHWLDQSFETNDWTNVGLYAHEELAYDMAQAAIGILKTTANVQSYLVAEGYMPVA